VAIYFGIKNADELLLATRSRFGAFNTGTVQVRGIYKTGNYFLREKIISRFDFIRDLDLADKGTASTTYLFFNDIRGISAQRDRLLVSLTAGGFIAEKPAGGNDALSAVASASPRNTNQDESVNQTRLTLSTIDEVTGIVTKVVAAIGSIVAALVGLTALFSYFPARNGGNIAAAEALNKAN
jgi:hypothetical protein